MSLEFAVGFDFDHTLGVDNKLEKMTALDMLSELAKAQGVSYDPAAAEAGADEMLHAFRSGAVPNIDGAVAGFFERFLELGAGLVDEAADFRTRVLERAPQHITALPGVHEMLARLDAMGVRYAILTNGWSPLQEEKARLIEFREPVYVSERIGARKPSPEAFGALAKYFELPFERIWYVGDDPAIDCAGAQALGMRTVWFNWEGKTYPTGLAAPLHVIEQLDELPGILQGQVKEAAKLGE